MPAFTAFFLLNVFLNQLLIHEAHCAIQLPAIVELQEPQKQEIQKAIRQQKTLNEFEKIWISDRFTQYMSFLGVTPVPENEKIFKDTFRRLLNASPQFLFCDEITDWICLEADPKIIPSTIWRANNTPGLGAPINAGKRLNIKSYFTHRWYQKLMNLEQNTEPMTAALSKIIKKYGQKNIWMALYGMDDISGSMKNVYDALISQITGGTLIRGVFDSMSPDLSAKGLTPELPILFSYSKPSEKITGQWLFDVASVVDLFQYSSTSELINKMNAAALPESPNARLEWEPAGIMHNKFFVFENQLGEKSVWTGTTNLSQTCMGDESNSNMGVLIKNNYISEAFLKEFNEMFEFSDEFYVHPEGKILNETGGKEIQKGRFHTKKKPNTQRYFVFDDATEVRVHFSPTDDGEHRAIIPMLLSARAGDVIRVSMFGGAGLELVRAFQYAAAKGAKVQILKDRLTGSAVGSWYTNTLAKITDPNPYINLVDRNGAEPGTIEFKYDNWPGLNHMKIGSLSRKSKKGIMKTEVFIVGSQNWSSSGNDINDENMVTIRNLKKSIPIGDQFNNMFDQYLWPNGN